MKALLTIALLLIAAPVSSQTFWSFDNQSARVELNAPHAGSLPLSCTEGSLFVQTGTGFAFCDPLNTWNVIASGNISGTGSAQAVTYWSGANTVTFDSGFTFAQAQQRLGIGFPGVSSGAVALTGTTSGTVILQAADAAGTTTFKLPIADGSNGDCLVTDGAGQWSWSNTCAGGSGITSLGGLSAAVQTFAAGSTNINVSSAVSTHTFTWTGQLSLARGGSNADLSAVCANCYIKMNAGSTALQTQALPIPAIHGGTGVTSYTAAGSILYATSTTTTASSAALVNHGVVIGGGAAQPPHTLTPGAVGLFLQSQGAGADPIWAPSAGGGCAGGGNVSISDLNTTGTVTFASPLADALYAVVLTARPGTGNPSVSPYTVTNLTANGFTVQLGGSPGSGKTMIVSWVVTPSSCTF